MTKRLYSDEELKNKIIKNPGSLRILLKNKVDVDDDIIFQAIESNTLVTLYLDEEKLGNKKLALKALTKSHTVFKNIPNSLKNDKNFVNKALKANPYCLRYINKELIASIDDEKNAILNHPLLVEFASNKTLEDLQFLKAVVKLNPDTLEYVQKSDKITKTFLFKTAKEYPCSIEKLSSDLLGEFFEIYPEECVSAILRKPSLIKYANESIRTDKEFILHILSIDINAYRHISPILASDEAFITSAIKINPNIKKLIKN